MIRSKRRGERGMTLMEVLVAMLIFTVVFLAALGLYQVANRAYLRTDAATIQQQNVRFAMDRLAETVRDAGANYNTLGSLTLPDEQIEGAWDAAIFVRGDYDNSRETALESTTYPIVTTGNDEIVGYVLRKPGGDVNNPVSLTMNMDFSAPRDATMSGGTITNEETATVKVATSTLAGETDPPYQLARVTFDSSGTPQYEVVAENIFRLSFSYFDKTGAAAIPTVGGADAQRADRAAVRQIDVNMIGMSSRPDPGYVDTNTYSPVEGASTKNLRKLSLTQHIVPPNLGLIGHRHMSSPAIVIQPPASITVCTGHCQYFGVTWPASTSAGVGSGPGRRRHPNRDRPVLRLSPADGNGAGIHILGRVNDRHRGQRLYGRRHRHRKQ
jgi:prepilin-type N-terminal cleavage/methylation domain-containing protein